VQDHAFIPRAELVASTPDIGFFGDYSTAPLRGQTHAETQLQSCFECVCSPKCFRTRIARDDSIASGLSSRESPGFQVESLNELVAIFVSFCLLGCRMLHLEHRLDQEAFRIVLVSTNRQHFAEDAACRAS
jgi:hypothetical protein